MDGRRADRFHADGAATTKGRVVAAAVVVVARGLVNAIDAPPRELIFVCVSKKQ